MPASKTRLASGGSASNSRWHGKRLGAEVRAIASAPARQRRPLLKQSAVLAPAVRSDVVTRARLAPLRRAVQRTRGSGSNGAALPRARALPVARAGASRRAGRARIRARADMGGGYGFVTACVRQQQPRRAIRAQVPLLLRHASSYGGIPPILRSPEHLRRKRRWKDGLTCQSQDRRTRSSSGASRCS